MDDLEAVEWAALVELEAEQLQASLEARPVDEAVQHRAVVAVKVMERGGQR